MKLNKNLIFLIAIFCLSIFLRLIRQPNYPSCLHRDESHFAYNAYSILKTGRDEWGEFLPLHFKFNGEYHVPVIFYLMAGSFAIFGANDIAVRLPAIILGSFIPIITFFLTKKIFNNKNAAYFSAFLLAINPWQIINARASGEISIISLFFSSLGILFLFNFLNKQKKYYLFLASISIIFSYYSYIASRLDIPLLLILFLFIYFKKIPSKKISLPVLFFLIIFPFILVYKYPNRYQGTSIISKNFNPDQLTMPIEFELKKNNLSLFYKNAARDTIFEFIDNYFDYISPYYIFRNLGEPDRTNIKHIGSLYLIELTFVIFGFYTLAKAKNNKNQLFLALALLATPIVGSLTHNFPDRPNTARTVNYFFFLSVVSGIGLWQIFSLFPQKLKKISTALISLILIANFTFFVFQLKKSDQYLGRARSCGYKDLFLYTEKIKNTYDKVYIGTQFDYPYVHLLWYSKYPPEKYHQFIKNNPKENEIDFIHTDPHHDWAFDRYVFTHNSCPLIAQENILLVGTFNYCKERHQISVYRDKNKRLVFKKEDKPLQIYQEILEITEPSSKQAFNLYSYNQKISEEFKTEDLKYFTPADIY